MLVIESLTTHYSWNIFVKQCHTHFGFETLSEKKSNFYNKKLLNVLLQRRFNFTCWSATQNKNNMQSHCLVTMFLFFSSGRSFSTVCDAQVLQLLHAISVQSERRRENRIITNTHCDWPLFHRCFLCRCA